MINTLNRIFIVGAFVSVLAFSAGKVCIAQTLPADSCGRIISLAPSITEMLFALNLGANVVAVTNYCKFPLEASRLPNLGGLFDTNLEAGMLLRPNIVVGLPESKTTIDNFKRLGIQTLNISDRSIQDIYESLATICKVCGCEKLSEKLILDLKAEIQPLIVERQKEETLPVALIVASSISAGAEELYLSGNDGYYSSIFRLLNAKNVFSNNTAAIPSSSMETIVVLSPRIIFVVEASSEKFDDLKKRFSLYAPKAVVVQLQGDYSVVPGPRFPLLVKDIAEGLRRYSK